MKRYIFIIFCFISALGFAQPKIGLTLGSPNGSTPNGCDTTTNTPITIEFVGQLTCCYEMVNGASVKRENCDNVIFGSCINKETECVESQEWTYGIDNTGTDYAWPNATYELTLSDGTVLTWTQTSASNGGWSAQLTEWSNSIQAAADGINLNWLVEPRAVNNAVPSDISGGYGVNLTPTGLAGAPSVNIAQGLIDGGMAARYVNIQICTGDPVPVSSKVISHDDSPRFAGDYDNNGRAELQLVTAGAILGEKLKFKVCQECKEGGDEWLIEDGKNNWRKATEGEIPFCNEPCGTLVTAPPPPDSDCTFFVETFCDSNNETDNTLFTQSVTRKVTYCSGQPTFIEYFVPDPDDPSAFLPYDLVGQFVDCVTGQSVDVPTPECNEFEYVGLLYKYIPKGEVGANLEYWQPSALGGTAVAHDNVSNIFTNDGTNYNHPNAPSHTGVHPTFGYSTSNGTFLSALGLTSNTETSGADQVKISGYVYMPSAGTWSDNNTNTGERGLIAASLCCPSELEVLQERVTDTPASDRFVFTNVSVPAGIHYVEMMTSDLSAWQGINLVTGDGSDIMVSTEKPEIVCIPVIKCVDSGILLNAETMGIVEVGDLDTWCAPTGCQEVTSSGGGGGTFEDLDDTDDDIDIEETLICANDGQQVIMVTQYDELGNVISTTYRDVKGSPVEIENFDCFECETFKYYLLEGVTGTLRNREWDLGDRPTAFITTAEGAAIRENFDFTATPTIDGTWNNLGVNDTNSSNDVQDAQIIEGYIFVDTPIEVRWTGTSAGYFALEIGQCCGATDVVIEGSRGDNTAAPTPSFSLPVGTHFIRLWNIDDWANTSRTFQYSIDGGVTFVSDNTPPNVQLSQTKPQFSCELGCLKNGITYQQDEVTELSINNSTTFLCEPTCNPTPVVVEAKATPISFEKCCFLLEGDPNDPCAKDSCITANKILLSDLTFVIQDDEGNAVTGKQVDCSTCNATDEPNCIDNFEYDKSADTDDGDLTGTGWNVADYLSDEPLCGDFKVSYKIDYSQPSNLNIISLTDNPTSASIYGNFSLYHYNYNLGATDRDWVRVNQLGDGGFVTGWVDLTAVPSMLVCIERVGATVTYEVNGNIIYTETTANTNAMYLRVSPYSHPTNVWSTGNHFIEFNEICEKESVATNSLRRSLRSMNGFFKEYNDKEAIGIMQGDGLTLEEANAVFENSGIEIPTDGWSKKVKVSLTQIEGVHECYFRLSVDEIVNDKTISGNHNPVLDILGLSKSGNEREKVERIVKHLESLGYR